MVQVLCVGHSAWDMTLTVADYPGEDTKIEANSLRESGGGPAANAAYLLASWGVPTAFVGIIGEDSFGQRIVTEFEQVGVELSSDPLSPTRPTPVSLILVSEQSGSRTIVTRKSPGPPVKLPSYSSPPQVLLFDGHELPASLEALERYPNALSILDAGSLREGTIELARRVEFLIASEKFARQVTGLATLDSVADRSRAIGTLSKMNGRDVVVTLGSRGLIHGNEVNCHSLPAFPVQAIDTTGAGDIFHGAFAYGLLKGFPFEDNLRFSSMAAALSVQKPGGRGSIPTREDVEKSLVKAE